MEPIPQHSSITQAICLINKFKNKTNWKIDILKTLENELESSLYVIKSLDTWTFNHYSTLALSNLSHKELITTGENALRKINTLIRNEHIFPSKHDVPPLWLLDEKGKAIDCTAIIQAINFFSDNPEWVEENLKESQAYFSLLTDTDFILNQLPKTVFEKYAKLLTCYPHLFPLENRKSSVTKIQSLQIPTNHVVCLSDKFYTALTGPMKEKEEKAIHLQLEHYNQNVVSTFLTFLSSGQVVITGKNVMDLFYLSDEHGIKTLLMKCIAYIDEHFVPKDILKLLQIGIDTHTPELIWTCMRKLKECLHLNTSTVSKEVQDLLRIKADHLPIFENKPGELIFKNLNINIEWIKCLGNYMPLSLRIIAEISSKHFFKILKIDSIETLIINFMDFKINEHGKALNQLKNLKEFGNTSFFLKSFKEFEDYLSDLSSISVCTLALGTQITQKDFDLLHKKLPNLKELYVCNNNKIEYIPFKNLKFFYFNNCASLKEISADYATEVCIINCKAIPYLSAPKALFVEFTNGLSLKELFVPNASHIDCFGCSSLKKLLAPKARHIFCNSCSSLKKLYVNNAEEISCRDCIDLITLLANKAKSIDTSNCISLKKLSANNAEIVDLFRCIALTTLTVPKATKIMCAECSMLTTISAENAKIINCNKCPQLQSLSVPKAIQINCNSCIQLTKINADKAKTIQCRDCILLEELSAPRAELVNCFHCLSLTKLSADKAKHIHCSKCTSLKELIAPQAKIFNGDDCISLTKLHLDKGKDISYKNCSALRELSLDNMEEVFCVDFPFLTTLSAQNAKTIDCRGCKKLIKLSSKKASTVHCQDNQSILFILPKNCKIIKS